MSELLKETNQIEDQEEELNSEDEWYARMEAAAIGTDEENDNDENNEINDHINKENEEISEEKYYENMLAANIETSEQLFVDEKDQVWNKIVNNLAEQNFNPPLPSLSSVTSNSTTSTTSTLLSPLSSLSLSSSSSLPQDLLDTANLYEVNENDTSLHVLIKDTLFNFLPETSKYYSLLSNPTKLYEKNVKVFINNKTLPSIIFFISYDNKILYDLKISFYIKLFNTSLLDYYYYILKILINYYVKNYKIKSIKFNGINELYHEEIIEKYFTKNTSLPTSTSPFYYVERCYQYHLSHEIFHYLDKVKNFQERILPSVFYYDVLTEEDAYIVNDTWKYKNESSLELVKGMIKKNINVCIREKKEEGRDQPVSWCLVYDDGALGMLQALPNYRGKGLAKSTVIKLIHTLKASESYNITPYCFIETKNIDSITIFNSLGFQQTIGYVWSGLREDPEELIKNF